MTPQICDNRQNVNIHRVFSKLFGTDELIVSLDRIGMMRPTKDIPYKDGKRDKPDWKSITGWLHWDLNPWTGRTSIYGWGANYPMNKDAMNIENNGYKILKVQGILALYDCGEKAGGFHGVPGFQQDMQNWATNNLHLKEQWCYPRSVDETTVQVPKDDPVREYIQTLPIRKGSILIWNSMLPHGTHPNDSDKFRLIQYLKMAPASDPAITPAMKTKDVYPSHSLTLPKVNFELTDLGKKLLGLRSWKADIEEVPRTFALHCAFALGTVFSLYMLSR
jgi:hypothetical protein